MVQYDGIIIGAGQSGIPLALKLAKAGMEIALIEKNAVGGTCINDGCTPTKALIASAENAYRIAHSHKWGIDVSSFSIDFEQVMKRKNAIVRQFRSGSESSIEKAKNLKLLKGEACFTGPNELVVKLDTNMEHLKAENIFIDVGMEPDIPVLEGLNVVPFLTSSSILELTQRPEHLLILGGNYTGLEFAQLFARLGSQVTVIEKKEQILSREDPDISKTLTEILEKEGIRIYTGAAASSVKGAPPILTFNHEGREKQVKGSHLLVTTGRKPQTAALALDKAGIKTDEKGFIQVNDQLETSVKGVFAMGDVKGGPAFTHISYNDHYIVFDKLINGIDRKYADRQVPYCMFTDPQLGRVGLTEADARARGIAVEIARLPMSKSSRGIETGNTEGVMKVVIEKDTEKLLGVAVLSAEGGEVMSVLQMAMAAGYTATQLKEEVFAHPLYSESINNLFMSLG